MFPTEEISLFLVLMSVVEAPNTSALSRRSDFGLGFHAGFTIPFTT